MSALARRPALALLPCLAALVLMVGAGPAAAAEPEFTLVIRNHRFEPAELTVPAGQKIKLTVDNQDSSAEEFESASLRREKLVPAGQKIVIYVGPLKPGSYPFFGEFNQATAQGKLIAQ